MQPTSCFHHRVRDPLLGVPQHIFDDTAAFHPGEVMLYLYSNASQLPIPLLFGGREFASARLFFAPGMSASLLARSPEPPCLCTSLESARRFGRSGIRQNSD